MPDRSSPALAFAQSNSTIAGVVKDSSGAVLPGVTVEASSPALIEKVRTVVTDGAGQYKIVNLVPGVYTVTFTLTGFNTVKREGIELTSSFTATVNADMRVGSLEETITVSGESPTVDVQNVTQQQVMTRDVINADSGGHEVDRPDRRAHPGRHEHQPGRRRHGVFGVGHRDPRQPPATSRRRSTTG